MKLPKAILIFTSLLFLTGVSSQLSAATEVITNFGQGNWYSWDTRDSSGTILNGTNDTSPSITTTLANRAVGPASTANDTAIGQQIVFMQEGQTVNDVADASGNPPPAGPAGSLNGLGYVRLDGTGNNNGKSDLSYVDTNGIAAATALTDPSFGLSYRYYIQGQPNFRTLGLNIALTNNAQSNVYIFAYVDPAPGANGWFTSSVSANSGLFRLITNTGQVEGGATQTLAGWQSDPTYGSAVFGGTESVFRIGFNVGSGQSNDLQYLDWMQTNLLNGGDVIDFQAVPEPTTWLAASLAGLMLIVQIVRARAFSRRTTETLKS